MTPLTIRRLPIDLETPFARQWHGGDAFRSAFFNALSMSFPAGEQFLIDAVQGGELGVHWLRDKAAQWAPVGSAP